jgi:hypothetical protein
VQGEVGLTVNEYKWPRQGDPTADDWVEWQHYMRAITQQMTGPHQKLGDWHGEKDNPWFFALDASSIYQQVEGGWLSYRKRGATRSGYYERSGTLPPAITSHQAVRKFHQAWASLKTYKRTREVGPDTFAAHITALPEERRWPIMDFDERNSDRVIESLRKGWAIAVCDGSCKEGKDASAWTIVVDTEGGSISGCNRVNGNVGCQSSY